MPISGFQEFKERYYRIINQIAIKAIDIKPDSITSDKFSFELSELERLKGIAHAADVIDEIEDFKFEFDGLLSEEKNMKIFQYFRDIDNGKEVKIDIINQLDIPDISKQEIQAQGFVNAFDKMKEKGSDPEFQKYYQNVQSLSRQLNLLKVENPELSASLDRANGIFDSFNKVYEKAPDKSVLQIGDMLSKAEKAYELQQELKSELAQHIALNGIAIFDENGEVSKQFDNLEVGNIFEDKSLDEVISPYLNKNFKDLITQQDEIVKLNKVFNALDINGKNVDSFKKLVDVERARIDRQKIAEPKKSVETDIKHTVKSQQSTAKQVSTDSGVKSISRSNALKERLARNILEVAKVSPEKIKDIMTSSKMINAKEAIMKRAMNTLESLGVNEEDLDRIGPTNALSKVKNEDLQNQIKNQSEELIAQVGRVSSNSMDSQDMRGKENLHEKYQDKASKLGKGAFDKNVVEALNYEKTKDDRGKGKTLAYNAFYRKPMQLLNALRPKEDKPFFTPAKTALAGLIALAVLAPPLGAIVAIPLLCKAAKNQLYDDTIIEDIAQITGKKMMEWVGKLKGMVTGKPYEKPIEKVKEGMINEGALDKVSVKSLIPEKTQNLEQTVAKDQTLEKTQTLASVQEGVKVTQEQSTKRVEDGVKSLIKPKDKLQEMIRSDPELEKIIAKAKEIAGKDTLGKQRPMDDLDLMSAKSRVTNEVKKHKGSGVGF